MLRSNPYKWWNWLAFVAAMVVNALANTAVLGEKRQGKYRTNTQP